MQPRLAQSSQSSCHIPPGSWGSRHTSLCLDSSLILSYSWVHTCSMFPVYQKVCFIDLKLQITNYFVNIVRLVNNLFQLLCYLRALKVIKFRSRRFCSHIDTEKAFLLCTEKSYFSYNIIWLWFFLPQLLHDHSYLFSHLNSDPFCFLLENKQASK